MGLKIKQVLQQGIAAHKNGKIKDAERLYRAILQSQPGHPDANHNLGVLAVSVNKSYIALPLFKTALEAYPKVEQFWFSYIEALIKEQQFDNARRVLERAKKQGVVGEKLNVLESQLNTIKKNGNVVSLSPSPEQLNNLLKYFQKGWLDDAEKLALSVTKEFPMHSFGWKILGAVLVQTNKMSKALAANKTAVALSPQDAEVHNNLAVTFKDLGKLEEAEESSRQSITLKPDLAEAYNNLGLTLQEMGRLDEAKASYNKAIALNPNFTDAYWNLHGSQKTIKDAEHFIDICLKVDKNHVESRLTKAALRFYRGDKSYFNNLMQSESKQHPLMRSFSWVFSLPNLPELHFDKWCFFDAVVKKSKTEKPFYEFGVWRASSFKYLIKVFKKGYGFDTFTGLPEDWDVGIHIEKKGTYTSDGNVPKIKGGEFVVGKFEDTLPVFFSKNRPIASVINFDADLYSSTICALNFSKKVMDKDTILIFDELITNENWELDEFRALNEFCSINNFSYEVIAISFFTKQVAVKLTGI
tara:strand:- start:85 stop:1665 length:1581 start_codon:yes stop_codon:yes gene_type:complete